jgi:hypothetical protein
MNGADKEHEHEHEHDKTLGTSELGPPSVVNLNEMFDPIEYSCPKVPFSSRPRGNRESYLSTFSGYSGKIESAEQATEQQPIKVVIQQDEGDPSDNSGQSDAKSDYSFNFGKLPTVRQASSGKKSDFNYNTHVGGSVPPRSPRRPKSDIISGKMSEELHKEIEKFNKRNKRMSLNDDLNDLMAKAKSIGSIDLDIDDTNSKDAGESNSIPHSTESFKNDSPNEASHDHIDQPLAVVSTDGETPSVSEPERIQKPILETLKDHGTQSTETVASDQGQHALENEEQQDHTFVAATSERDLEQTKDTIDDLKQDVSKSPIINPQTEINGDTSVDRSVSGTRHDEANAENVILQEGGYQQQLATTTTNPSPNLSEACMPTNLQQQQIATQLRQIQENGQSKSKVPNQPPPISPSQQQKLLHKGLLVQSQMGFSPIKQRNLPPRPKHEDITKARELSNTTKNRVDLFGIEVASNFSDNSIVQLIAPRVYQPEPELDISDDKDPGLSNTILEQVKSKKDDANDYYDIEEPEILHKPSTKKKSRSSMRKLKKDKELKPFSYSTLIKLLESMNGTIIGEEFSQLDLPVKEKQLIEKIIDSLSRLTSDMVTDQARYEVGIQRLEKALRVLEGFM